VVVGMDRYGYGNVGDEWLEEANRMRKPIL
jgi:hypothetical protein